MDIVQYHLRRNLVAYKSHRKKKIAEAKKLKARTSIHIEKGIQLAL